MAMQSPEILLSSLNAALRHLRGACSDIGDEEIDEKLLGVMRRLLLAEILGNSWILAMGGSQGAGKTTLMANLYDLQGKEPNWLQSNEGRGEKMPILITEVTGLQLPQGYVRRLSFNETFKSFNLKDEPVSVADFQQAIYDPNAEDLLPILQVPPRYFKRPNQAWLLLPGYEKQERANRSWQELMRQAMIAAGGCIAVTDETRMADQQQLEIVKDMLENELEGIEPYIVISKTESHRNNPKQLNDLRTSAQTTFRVKPEHANSHIIFTGTDDSEYIKEWMPLLCSAIEDLNKVGDSNRATQLNQLSEIIGKDLTRVLTTIRSKSKLYFSNKSEACDGAEVLEEVLDTFDEAVEELRKAHNEKISELARNTYSKATKHLDKGLEEYGKLKHWMSNAFDSASKTKRKIQELVQDSWGQAQPNFFDSYAKSLTDLIFSKLGKIDFNKDVTKNNASNLPPEVLKKRIQLGYNHASGEAVKFNQLTAERVNDIKILLGHAATQEHGCTEDLSKQLPKSVGLIPVISLEYARLFYTLPEAMDLQNPNVSCPDSEQGFSDNFVMEGTESLKVAMELGKTAIRSTAAVLAVDILNDGESDILGAIVEQPTDDTPDLNTSSVPMPVTLHPVAVTATAVVAATYLTAKAITGLRAIEKETSAQAYNILGAIHDYHVNHLKKQFEETMEVSRKLVREKIQARYRMDETLMRKDRLAKAIADVRSITSDLQYEINSSSSGLQIFRTTRS